MQKNNEEIGCEFASASLQLTPVALKKATGWVKAQKHKKRRKLKWTTR
ncbi:hypothetical protein [Latilactobacillus fragifolii]|nr:hypothetical protein [Latilactobacillus fragifolii]